MKIFHKSGVLFISLLAPEPSHQGTRLHRGRQRTLTFSYDFLEPNRGLTKFPVQHYFTGLSVEASDQPVREEHPHEAQGGELHPPSLLCLPPCQL